MFNIYAAALAHSYIFPLLSIWPPPVAIGLTAFCFSLLLIFFFFQNMWAHGLWAELRSPPVTENLISVELFFCLSFLHALCFALAILPTLPEHIPFFFPWLACTGSFRLLRGLIFHKSFQSGKVSLPCAFESPYRWFSHCNCTSHII